jgi:hypothetical protein
VAGVWSLYSDRRKNGYCHFSHQTVFYLYVVPYIGIAGHLLPDYRLLDEYQKLHQEFPAQSCQVPLDSFPVFPTAVLHIFISLSNLLGLVPRSSASPLMLPLRGE